MIKRILVAIDGSEHAYKALDFALDLAEKYSAAVTIINVFQAPMIPIAPPAGYLAEGELSTYSIAYDDLVREVKAAHEKILSHALRRARRLKPNLEVSTLLKEGRPADEIIKTAKEGEFDLIVMGHRGLGRVKEFFLGSVSDRVADEAHCPILIVK
ncbi:MAG: universal stress protein [Candidatus Bathyarchaeia archaeon]